MKKNVGSLLALYPAPVTVIGAMNGAKPTWTLVAHIGMICKSPLTMECSVVDVYNTPNFEGFICTLDNTYVNEKNLNEKDKVDYDTLKPVLFEFPTYQYLRTGEVIGKCLSFKNTPEK